MSRKWICWARATVDRQISVAKQASFDQKRFLASRSSLGGETKRDVSARLKTCPSQNSCPSQKSCPSQNQSERQSFCSISGHALWTLTTLLRPSSILCGSRASPGLDGSETLPHTFTRRSETRRHTLGMDGSETRPHTGQR